MSRKRRYWLTGRYPLPFGVFFLIAGILEVIFTDSLVLSLLVVAAGAIFVVVGLRWRKEDRHDRSHDTPTAE